VNFSKEFSPFDQILFDEAVQPMWMYDTETFCFIDVNESAIRLYGYSRAEFMRMSIVDVRPSEDIPVLLEVIEHLDFLDFTVTNTRQWRHIKKDGSIIDVEIQAQSVHYNSKLVRLIQIQDLSVQAQIPSVPDHDYEVESLEKAIVTSDNIASGSIIMEDAFMQGSVLDSILLQSLLDDARNPVIVIQGIAKSLQYALEYDEPKKAHEYFPILLQTQQRLLNILENFDRFRNIETDVLLVQYRYFNAQDILTPILQKQIERAKEQGVTIHCTLPERTIPMYTDENFLSTIFQYLLTNAVIHSRLNNVIQVRVAKLGKADEKGVSQSFLCIEVHDEDSDLLLEQAREIIAGGIPSVQADAVPRLSGTSLGLYMAKKLVSQLKGTMLVYENQSATDTDEPWYSHRGLTFVVEIPAYVLHSSSKNPKRELVLE
jgi:PAS domain S-box-containing protein